jgi:hypothetical protein
MILSTPPYSSNNQNDINSINIKINTSESPQTPLKRKDTLQIKQKLTEVLGSNSNEYWNCLKNYLTGKLSKNEFDKSIKNLIGDQLSLHNSLIYSIIYNSQKNILPREGSSQLLSSVNSDGKDNNSLKRKNKFKKSNSLNKRLKIKEEFMSLEKIDRDKIRGLVKKYPEPKTKMPTFSSHYIQNKPTKEIPPSFKDLQDIPGMNDNLLKERIEFVASLEGINGITDEALVLMNYALRSKLKGIIENCLARRIKNENALETPTTPVMQFRPRPTYESNNQINQQPLPQITITDTTEIPINSSNNENTNSNINNNLISTSIKTENKSSDINNKILSATSATTTNNNEILTSINNSSQDTNSLNKSSNEQKDSNSLSNTQDSNEKKLDTTTQNNNEKKLDTTTQDNKLIINSNNTAYQSSVTNAITTPTKLSTNNSNTKGSIPSLKNKILQVKASLQKKLKEEGQNTTVKVMHSMKPGTLLCERGGFIEVSKELSNGVKPNSSISVEKLDTLPLPNIISNNRKPKNRMEELYKIYSKGSLETIKESEDESTTTPSINTNKLTSTTTNSINNHNATTSSNLNSNLPSSSNVSLLKEVKNEIDENEGGFNSTVNKDDDLFNMLISSSDILSFDKTNDIFHTPLINTTTTAAAQAVSTTSTTTTTPSLSSAIVSTTPNPTHSLTSTTSSQLPFNSTDKINRKETSQIGSTSSGSLSISTTINKTNTYYRSSLGDKENDNDIDEVFSEFDVDANLSQRHLISLNEILFAHEINPQHIFDNSSYSSELLENLICVLAENDHSVIE